MGNRFAIDTLDRFDRVLEELHQTSGAIALDLEVAGPDGKGTTDLYKGRIEGIAVAYFHGQPRRVRSVYLPFLYYPSVLPFPRVMADLHEVLLGNPDRELVVHNGFFDVRGLILNGGGPIACEVFDTLIADWLLDPDRAHDLGSCAKRALGEGKSASYKEVEAKRGLFDASPLVDYARKDAELTLRLSEFYKDAHTDRSLENLMSLEMGVLPEVIEMSLRGLPIDVPYCKALRKKYTAKMGELTDEMKTLAGDPNLNPGSQPQVAATLWGKLKLTPPRWAKVGKSGIVSTNKEVLEAIADQHPFAKHLRYFRQLQTLRGTFIESFLKYQEESSDGRMHASFNQVLVSGRMSTREPNLMNLPRDGEGVEIRAAIKAPPGRTFVRCDVSQIELRWVAHHSQDPELLRCYREGLDVHQMTATACDCSRQEAKPVNFGLIYGMSAYTLAIVLGISEEAAEEYIDGYFGLYRGVGRWQDDVELTLNEEGWTETAFGLRRYFDLTKPLKEKNAGRPWYYEHILRQAINHIIQGSAAHQFKVAMRNARIYRYGGRVSVAEQHMTEEQFAAIHAFKPEWRDEVFPVLTIHDEGVFEAPEEIAPQVGDWLKAIMETAVQIPDIPFVAEYKVTQRLGERMGAPVVADA